MSDSSSDTESSCGWTIISNEGSDIETLGPDNGQDGGPELASPPPVTMQEEQEAFPVKSNEEMTDHSLDATLKEETLEETEDISEAVEEVTMNEQVTLCSSSDHSDIVSLEQSRGLGSWEERADAEEEAVSGEELYLGTSSSSQYTFSSAEPALFPAAPPVADSSSSEDELVEQPSPTLRRRKGRRSTSTTSETEDLQPPTEEERPHEPQAVPVPAPARGHASSTLNKCILLALVIAISMGFGHFYGTVQIQEKQKVEEKVRVGELTDVRDLHQCQKEQELIAENEAVVQHLREDLEEKRGMVLSLTGIMDKITKENQQLRVKQAELQGQQEDLAVQLKETVEERSEMESRQKHLATENQLLKSSLEREEESVSVLQEELRNLRAQIRNLEERGAGAEVVLSENRRLKNHLEDERQRIRTFLSQKEMLMAEAQALRKELDKERRVTDRLKEEMEQLSSQSSGPGENADPETQEMQARLVDLEKKLNFEQQRSDLWERLYVETKEERTKGDKEVRPKKPKGSMMGKVKETFDAVKNSTKEFVHHHKEQIKKAKEAVKENLRKFSDSVKSTFRHFKDSAMHMFDKHRRPHQWRFHERKDAKAERCERHQVCPEDPKNKNSDETVWPHEHHKPLHQHPRKSTADTFHTGRNTRKPGVKVQQDQEQMQYEAAPKGCSGVIDCAYQESMGLFNKALEPIRADEFNQLIHSYLQQEVDHFHHWRELESFINGYFHNGVFIHDQMLFTDFVSGVEDYLEDMDEYQRYDDDVFEDLDDYIYRHFFGDTYSKHYGASRPFEMPVSKHKEDRQSRHRRKLPQGHPQRGPQTERKWNRPGRSTGRHVANVKIELGPMPFDPKY